MAGASRPIKPEELERCAANGVELCDIQTATPHTLRLGAVQIPRAEYERRLHDALSS